LLPADRAIEPLAFNDATLRGHTCSHVPTVCQHGNPAYVALGDTTIPPIRIQSAWRHNDNNINNIGAVRSVGSRRIAAKLVGRRRTGFSGQSSCPKRRAHCCPSAPGHAESWLRPTVPFASHQHPHLVLCGVAIIMGEHSTKYELA